jgi:hypothetical protein
MTTIKQKISIASYIDAADTLADLHEVYIDQFVTRAHVELYKLLANTMQLCMDIQSNLLCDEIVEQMRKKLRSEFNIKVQKNTPTTTVVVRYVMRAHRKTAHVYGRVIQKAIDASILPINLPNFIKDSGGIEKLRQAGVTANKNDAEGWARTINRLTSLPREKLPNSSGHVSLANPDNDLHILHDRTRFKYLICDERIDGLHIVGVAYPTLQLEEQIMKDYIFAMRLVAMHQTPKFWQMCKDATADMDTVISWGKANGASNPQLALGMLNKLGVTLPKDDLESIRKATEARRIMDEEHAVRMAELAKAAAERQSMRIALQNSENGLLNNSQEKLAA